MIPAAYLLAIASSVVYGTADFLGGFTARRAPILMVLIVSQGAGLLFVAALLPFMERPTLEAADYGWAVVAGLTGGGGVALLYAALSVGTMSAVAPTTAVCAIAIPVFVGLALGERYGVATFTGIVLAAVAVALISRGPVDESGVSSRHSGLAFPLAVTAGVLIGFFLVALERGGAGSGLWPLFLARIVSVAFFLVAALFMKFERTRGSTFALIVTSGVIDMLANILYVFAVRSGSLGIVATITSLYPASTVLLARLILHERLRAVQWAGVGCAGAAIILIVAS